MSTATLTRPKTGTPANGKAAARKASSPAPNAPDIRKLRQAAELLKAVSDATRLQVLLTLESIGERHVGELLGDTGIGSQPALSHHLALLRHARLIEARRSGKHNYYGLTEGGRELARVVGGVAG